MRSPDLSSFAPAPAAGGADTDEQRLQKELASRLARVCAHLDRASFAALVQTIVARKLRWARQEVDEMLAARRKHAD